MDLRVWIVTNLKQLKVNKVLGYFRLPTKKKTHYELRCWTLKFTQCYQESRESFEEESRKRRRRQKNIMWCLKLPSGCYREWLTRKHFSWADNSLELAEKILLIEWVFVYFNTVRCPAYISRRAYRNKTSITKRSFENLPKLFLSTRFMLSHFVRRSFLIK